MGELFWKDQTSYSRSEDPAKTPWRVATLEVYGLVITLCRSHLANPHEWVVYCPPFFPHHVLGRHEHISEDTAKDMAVSLAANRLLAILDFLAPAGLDMPRTEDEPGFDEVA